MSDYTTLADWCERCGPAIYCTTRRLRWEIGAKGSGRWVHVPTGFVFDVSVPRWLHWLVDPHDERFLKAACLHDHILVVERWDRVTAAAAFNAGLAASGVGTWARLGLTLIVIAWNWN